MAIKTGDIVTYAFKAGFFKVGEITEYPNSTLHRIQLTQIAKADFTLIKKSKSFHYACEISSHSGLKVVDQDTIDQLMEQKTNEYKLLISNMCAFKEFIS